MTLSAQDTEITVTNVSVWIRATDKSGKPLLGLQQADFEVFEDGKKVTPTCFEEATFSVEAASTPAVEPAQTQTQPESDRKQVVFLLDEWNTSQVELLHLKQRAIEFLQQISKTWDISLISVIPGLIHTYVESTRDPAVIREALEKISANPTRDLTALNNRRDLGMALEVARRMPRKDPRVIEELCGRARGYALEEKALSFDWLKSLKQFDRYIQKQPPGTHKVVLFFSGGISSNPGKPYFDMVRESPVMAEYVSDEFEVRRAFPSCDDEGGLDLQKDLKKLVGQLNRYNITFYTVSSRGPLNDLLETVREADARYNISDLSFLGDYTDFLALVADETGGLYFGNSLNFKRGFDAIVADLNHQYLICYTPPERNETGHHSIKVKTKKSGVKLRHREGYED